MIKEAIIPLAGLGTRLLPFSKVIPKELLPLGNTTILEVILKECFEAGIKKIILVISNRKKKITYVYQNSPKGLGDALYSCRNKIKGNFFLLVLPDDIIKSNNCSKDIIAINKKYHCSVIASKKVKKSELSRYGIFKVSSKNKNLFNIQKVVEKPKVYRELSNFAIIGRYILNKNIFTAIKNIKFGTGGEKQLTDAINFLLIKNEKFKGYIFKGKYLDCGTMSGYLNSLKYNL
jgi:UTP--glucose-1-phosphate uridylyltransferase